MKLAVLPQLSLAIHVRVIVLLQEFPGALWLSLKLTDTEPWQESLAVTMGAAGTLPKHW